MYLLWRNCEPFWFTVITKTRELVTENRPELNCFAVSSGNVVQKFCVWCYFYNVGKLIHKITKVRLYFHINSYTENLLKVLKIPFKTYSKTDCAYEKCFFRQYKASVLYFCCVPLNYIMLQDSLPYYSILYSFFWFTTL